MKKYILVLLVVLVTAGIAYAYDDHDFQIWNTESEEFKINKKTKIVMEQEFRWGDNATEFYYQHYDAGIFYDFTKWLNAGGGYRQIYELFNREFRWISEPYLTLTFSGELTGFKLDNRSRMEFNDYDYKTDFWRYRNKTGIKFPWKFTKFEIQPFVSEEIFVVFGGLPTKFNQNRLSAGLGFNIIKHVKGEVYYMLQSSRWNTTWKEANVLGTKIKISF